VGVIAIAADSVQDTAALQTDIPKITLLTDLDLKASEGFGLHIPGAEHPSPGTYVVDKSGAVIWRRLEENGKDWPTYPEVQSALK